MRYPVRAVSPHPPWDFSSFAPPGVDIIKNMMMARLHKGPSALTLHWFYHQVRLRGPWDYKNTIKKCYENFGNFSYGATGTAAGIPAEILLRAAGWAQRRAGNSNEKEFGIGYYRPPFGDDPKDQAWIKAGIDYALRSGF